MIRKILIIIASIMLIASSFVSAYPFIQGWIGENKQQQVIRCFVDEDKDNHLLNQLKADIQSYNEKIYDEKQIGLKDAWDFEEEIFSLSDYGLESESIGILEIDAMDITLPLYLGSSEDHLSKGAAVLGQTSMPIGGNNTNTVIAAHRGYRGESMFRNIENLEIGDTVKLTNLWETLVYKVCAVKVITPNQIENIKIIDNEEMLTLISCHPYTKNYQRYVVYCTKENSNNVEVYKNDEQITFESSSEDILFEKYTAIIGSVVPICLLIILVFLVKKKKI